MSKYKIFVVIVLMNCTMNGACQNKNEKALARRFWRSEIAPNYKNKQITVRVEVVQDADSDNTYSFVISRKQDTLFYINNSWQTHFKFTPSKVSSVNMLNREIMDGEKSGAYYSTMYDQYIEGEIECFRPLIFPRDYEKMDFVRLHDTLIGRTPYKVIYRDMKNGFFFNKESGKYDIPDFYHIQYFFNLHTRFIDRIITQPIQTDNNVAWPVEFFLDFRYELKKAVTDSIFDFSNHIYKEYSRHCDTFIPYSWSHSIQRDSALSDTVLHFPIVNLNNETTTIAKESGWILLDFWFFQCPGCREQFDKWKTEQDSTGKTVIEMNGIKIMAVNVTSDNLDELQKSAKQYKMAAMIYHAKGFGNILDMHIMPQYYLISPDKRIVLKTNNLNDYQNIIKAKRNYES